MKLSAPVFRLKRRAKLLARDQGIPLHEAQDRIARQEGFQRWSHLAAHHAEATTARLVLGALDPGDLVLLAGQREHGKTALAFDLMAEAVADGREVAYFSLEETDTAVERRLESFGLDRPAASAHVRYDTSDEISASVIVDRCARAAARSLVVVDYLQILDQQRAKPPLADQLEELRAFARGTGAIVVLLSQIDRSFETSNAAAPDLDHIRMPNPIDLSVFDKACFIHDGEIRLGAAA
ncbi:MAG: DNA helicase [Actinomycetota bacterium]